MGSPLAPPLVNGVWLRPMVRWHRGKRRAWWASAFVILAMPLPMRLHPLASCQFAAPMLFSGQQSSNSVEPVPRSLQPGRWERLIFQQDLLLEKEAEPLRFGFNPFSDRGAGWGEHWRFDI